MGMVQSHCRQQQQIISCPQSYPFHPTEKTTVVAFWPSNLDLQATTVFHPLCMCRGQAHTKSTLALGPIEIFQYQEKTLIFNNLTILTTPRT